MINRAIDLFLIYWLFTSTTAIIPLLVLGNAGSLSPEGNALLRLLILPSIIMMPVLFLSRWRDMVTLLLHNPLILLILILVWLSVSWSVLPDITVRRALSLSIYTLLACYLVLHHDSDWILKTLGWMILTLLATSLIFIIFLPGLSTMPDGRGLRGIFTHKNGMGELLILAIVILPQAIRQRVLPAMLAWGGLITALVLLPLVNSATALIVALVVLGIYGIWALFAYSKRVAIIVAVFGLSVGCFLMLGVIAYTDALFAVFGRDATLTGRTELWHYVWQMIQKRWLLGYGYEAFWEVEAFAKYAADSLQWDVPNSHNGYLDIFLNLGIIGLLLILAIMVTGFYRIALAFSRSTFHPAGLLLGLLGAYVSRALVESNLLGQNSIMWVLVVAFTVALTPSLARIKDQASAADATTQSRFGLS